MICSNTFKHIRLIPTSVLHLRDTTVGSSDTLLLPLIENAELIPDAPIPGAEIQPIGELRLLQEAEKIKGSNNHRLLYHGGWRQTDFDRESAPFMSISLGQRFNLLAESTNDAINRSRNRRNLNSSNSNDGEENIEEEYIYRRGFTSPPARQTLDLRQASSAQLSGGIKVWVGRFLHFDTLLSYTPNGADYSFAFQSERRMRSRQLHYIDHPRVGIVTKIYPVDETAPN